MDNLICLALDFGGTMLAAARVDTAAGRVLAQRQQAAPGYPCLSRPDLNY